ncbi:hypothetical protein L484_018917 [Morus notabilis]|uniref:Uncharacterized protein n=1 Tax=Morus notabilis TaxID=981085 RepID=W9RDE0_9ROSA|nr:hypothetical protein L484_018917 [Morus notabilis]
MPQPVLCKVQNAVEYLKIIGTLDEDENLTILHEEIDSFLIPDRWEEHGGATMLDESELVAAREDDRLDDLSELAMEEWALEGLHGVGVGSMRLK